MFKFSILPKFINKNSVKHINNLSKTYKITLNTDRNTLEYPYLMINNKFLQLTDNTENKSILHIKRNNKEYTIVNKKKIVIPPKTIVTNKICNLDSFYRVKISSNEKT